MCRTRPATRARTVTSFAVLSCLLAGCAHQTRPIQAPRDPRERWEAESDACWRRTMPAWLDDAALAGAARLDQLEGQASRANDSFRGGAFVAQPPPPAGGPRVAALLEERRVFQEHCAILLSSGKGPGTRL
jgi:hypothetical protein